MIARIEGKIVEKTPTHMVIDCNGVGYELSITLNTYTQTPNTGTCALFAQQIVREDAILLYGFHTGLEKEMFNLLISVSGVGASLANLILSAMEPSGVQEAIIEADVGALKGIKGIGLKTAERIIVDLRGKLSRDDSPFISSSQGNTMRDEALSALVMLGFNKKTAETGLSKVMKENKDHDSVEQLVKAVLKGI